MRSGSGDPVLDDGDISHVPYTIGQLTTGVAVKNQGNAATIRNSGQYVVSKAERQTVMMALLVCVTLPLALNAFPRQLCATRADKDQPECGP